MYRLFKLASAKTTNISFPASRCVTPCTLCNRVYFESDDRSILFRQPFARRFSTEDLHPERKSIKKLKKSKKPKKKYAELVEVSDANSNQTKAVIRKLSAKDVSKLSKKSEISLEQIDQLLEKSKGSLAHLMNAKKKPTFNESKHSETTAVVSDRNDYLFSRINLSPVNDEILQKKFDEETDWELIQHDTENVEMYSNADPQFSGSFPDEKPDCILSMKKKKKRKSADTVPISKNEVIKKESSKSKKSTNKSSELIEYEERLKIQKFNENLTSYIELCVQCDSLNMGLSTLERYHRMQRCKFTKVKLLTSPHPFNTLLQGFASKANSDKILHLMNMMSSSEISFTPQTFAACFECCSRLPSTPKNTELLTTFYEQFKSQGFTLQNLMTQCVYVRDQRDFVLKAVKALDENFTPIFEPTKKDYSLPFLQSLNEETYVHRSPAETVISISELNACIAEQMAAEMQMYQKIKSAVKPEKVTPQVEFFRKRWSELEDSWRTSIKEAFIRNLNNLELQQNETKTNCTVNVYPYLKVMNPDVYVDVAMLEIHKLLLGCQTFSPYLKTLQKELGRQVKNRYELKFKVQSNVVSKLTKTYKDYCRWYLHPETNGSSRNARHEWQRLSDENAMSGPTTLDNSEKHWPPNITVEVGKFLYNIIIQDVKVNVNAFVANKNKAARFVPAFYSLFRYQGECLVEEVKSSPVLFQLFKETNSDYLVFDINAMPMLTPPIPWTSPTSGCYLLTKVDFMRLYNFPINPVAATPNAQLYPIFDSLNQLAAVPWRISEQVLDVMLKVFRDGGSKKLNIPLSVPSFMKLKDSVGNMSLHQRIIENRKKADMHSLWCESLYRLSLAEHFRKRVFWLPHNLDFRGRVYPLPPHLTHLGSDAARSLLRFAKGEKLGPNGLDWLKIHCINLTGLKKKEGTAERLRYANEVLPEILESAENPLSGKMWWAEAEEDIWQILACCFEIKAALDSGDPENFVSHFPVHQDGSCNGLQHYAALGRDYEGGASVNLTPAEKPQDVYSCIVTLVDEQRKRDAAAGLVIAQQLEGFIKRKVIKQTIMTTVYGVTRYGARLQIAKQLKAVDDIPPELVWLGSLYLVEKTFDCLQEMFTSTKEIQDWFTDCARVIAGVFGKCVEWETPLGLTVIQPYCKHKKTTKPSALADINHPQASYLFPSILKQRSAFPPNFIHSLDSSHMMLTSLFCEKEGITFVSVHDCFWTHPSSVEMMNKICREQFVALHSRPILEDLSAYFTTKHQQINCFPGADKKTITGKEKITEMKTPGVFTRIPAKGSLNLEDILQSEFFFS